MSDLLNSANAVPAAPQTAGEPASMLPQSQDGIEGGISREDTTADPRDLLRRWRTLKNIAVELDDATLGDIAQRVKREYDLDEDSRADWKEKYRRWLDVAMQVAEEKTYPWPGASNVIYPLLTSAAVQFRARAYPAIVRGREVVKGRVIGDDSGIVAVPAGPNGQVTRMPASKAPPPPAPGTSPTSMPPVGMPAPGTSNSSHQTTGASWPMLVPPGVKRNRATAIGKHMSWQLLTEMPEWEEQTDRLLIVIAITGCMFRKTYYDPIKRRNVSEIVDPLRLSMPFKAKSFEETPRKTEEIDLYPWEIEERIRSGIFLDDEYGSNHDAEQDPDALVTFLEQHRRCDLDNDGYAEPYIVTIARDSGRLARIVSAYDDDTISFDEEKNTILSIDAVPFYTRYQFLPAIDGNVYGMGFGYLLYPLNEAINSSLNQMFDAGHLQNAGGGFIGSGMSMNTGAVRFQIGEYKIVNTSGTALKDNLVPIPFPGPSPVLLELLQFLVEGGREIASIKDILTGDLPGANVPGVLGLAVIQQGLKVFNAIFKSIHRSLHAEFQKLYRLNRLYLPEEADYQVGEQYFSIRRRDYEEGAGVEPVSDPEVVTDVQQLAHANFLLQFKDDPFCDGHEIRQRAFAAAGVADLDKVLRAELPPMPPNPQLVTAQTRAASAAAQHHLRAIELDMRHQNETTERAIQGTRDKASEIRDLAQAILYLAQARKSDNQIEMDWIDRQLENLRTQLDALSSTAVIPNPSGNAAGTGASASSAGGPIGGGIQGMASPSAHPGFPALSPGLSPGAGSFDAGQMAGGNGAVGG